MYIYILINYINQHLQAHYGADGIHQPLRSLVVSKRLFGDLTKQNGDLTSGISMKS